MTGENDAVRLLKNVDILLSFYTHSGTVARYYNNDTLTDGMLPLGGRQYEISRTDDIAALLSDVLLSTQHMGTACPRAT